MTRAAIYTYLLSLGLVFLSSDRIPEPVEYMTPMKIEVFRQGKIHGHRKVKKYFSPYLFENNHILAYYGHPRSRIMGIVGRMEMRDLGEKLERHAREYDRLNGPKGVVPAIYLIYGTAQPKGRIQRINKRLLQKYIDYTLEKGFLLYIDHQIGVNSLSAVMDELLPFLKYPHIHLAFDVEWRTDKPMKEIGFIRGEELNYLQKRMADYMRENTIPGIRQLVFHQFHWKMVRNPEEARTDFERVMLIHSTSGWGSPKLKLATHARNAKSTTMPDKAFKLWFFYTNKKGVHFDNPLMTPREVLNLDPEPGLIIYQ